MDNEGNPLQPFEDTIDIYSISLDEATVSMDMGQLSVDLLGASVADILEEIGLEAVKEYFGIKEEGDY